MAERGYLEAAEMMGIFTFMRSNDLVWNYAVNNWLMGEDPQPFDILAWNADSTRMPANMHCFYLRACYLGNELAGGTMELAGTRLRSRRDPRTTTTWSARSRTTSRRGRAATSRRRPCRTRTSATSSARRGTSPGSSTRRARRRGSGPAEVTPPDPKAWFEASDHHEGSWWEDWAEWIAARAGERVPPPRMGSRKHKPVGDAPGTYVLEE